MNARLYLRLHRRAGLALLVFGALLALASPLVLRRGMLHPEVYYFLPHYLGDRPMLSKVFDVSGADFGFYTARELSYFFDFIDCQIIDRCIARGWPHFLSATHYAFMTVTTGLMWWFARNRVKLPRLGSALLVLLFATTPAVFLGGSFFRSAKQGVTLCLLLCACAVAPAFRRRNSAEPFPVGAWLLTATAALFMGLFDRQGFFLILLLGLLLLLRARDRDGRIWVAAAALPAILVEIYNRRLGPALTEHFNGYRPSMEFQSLPWGDLIHHRDTAFDVLAYAPQLMLDNLRFLLGDIPLTLAAAALLLGVFWLAPRVLGDGASARARWSARGLILLVVFAMAGMNGLMILRLKAVLGLDFRRIYYGLPSIGVFWILAALAVAAVWRHGRVPARWVWSALAVLLLCNLGALSEHRHIIRAGLYKPHYRVSPAIIEALGRIRQLPPPVSGPFIELASQPETTPAEDDSMVRFFRTRYAPKPTPP